MSCKKNIHVPSESEMKDAKFDGEDGDKVSRLVLCYHNKREKESLQKNSIWSLNFSADSISLSLSHH